MSDPVKTGSFLSALPFWISLLFIPIIAAGAYYGGWWLALIPAFAFGAVTLLDAIGGLEHQNADPNTDGAELFWYKLITWIWFPIQIALVYGSLWWVTHTDALTTRESAFLMAGVGVVTGAIGIVYAHELMHQKSKWERRLGEALMTSVLYGHFVTEHLAVHHRHVGTPNDPATARYNESFYRFFIRVLFGSFISAWRVDAERTKKRSGSALAKSNPFWRYIGGALVFLAIAYLIGGWTGVWLYMLQAFVAILQLEQINYIEHYGLVRKYLGGGKYEPVAPRHSWNASHKVSNYLLINLQRHSDHHVKPDRRFPLLQTYQETEAPQLPAAYPMLVLMCYNPWIWRRVMNKRVRRWRSMYYPEILDWSDNSHRRAAA